MNKKAFTFGVLFSVKSFLILIAIVVVFYLLWWYIPRISIPTACPEYVIPDTMTFGINGGLFISPGQLWGAEFPASRWKDSSHVLVYSTPPAGNQEVAQTWAYDNCDISSCGPDSPICNKGSSEGQNVNYYYCNNLAYINKTQLVSDSGVVGKLVDKEYRISLTLEEVNRTTINPPYGSSITLGNFKVIDSHCGTK